MRNHDQKQRDMCRSILPATNRRSARFDAAVIKRQNRRATRHTLREWATYDNAYDFDGHVYDTDDPATGGCGYSQTITEAMWDRRGHDKSSPLVRWAERLCETKYKDMDEWERKFFFKNMLPKNLIGRHAWSHIDHLFPEDDEFKYGFTFRRSDYVTKAERKRQNKEASEERVAATVERLRSVITSGNHAAFNRDLPCDVEPLAGLHDCERLARSGGWPRKIIEKWEK